MRYLLFFIFFCSRLGIADPPAEVHLTIERNHPVAQFDPRTALGAGIDGHWEGETMKMFTPPHIRQMLSAGLGPVAVRLRTELAVEAWHWNPQGSWSDAAHSQGYWTSDTSSKEPIMLSYGYKLPRRGNTLDEANDDGYSRLDDGDPATFWKSNPYLARPFTGEPDSSHPQWVVLDFGKEVPINTVRIYWADPYAKKFLVEYSHGGRVYFGGHPGGLFAPVWKRFSQGKISDGKGGGQSLRVAGKVVKVRYLRLWMMQGSGTAPADSGDLRDHLGYAIREISAGVCDGKGVFHDAVTHAPGHSQTITYASSTDPWHRASDRDPGVEQPGIDLLARCGITRGIPMMLAVPVFYDTPENAAALVSYTQERGIPVGRYELGEEPDGQRIAPDDFGALYAQAARKIRKITAHGILGGPSFVTVDVDRKDDTYRFDHRWWIRDFRRELARQGQAQNYQFLSFEWYPFDEVGEAETSQLPRSFAMLHQAMRRLLPLRLPLVIGEGNYSVFSCQQEVDLAGALLNAEMIAQFLSEGGESYFFYSYEPNTLESSYGDSWGNQTMLLQGHGKQADPATPLATYHALRLLTQEWMNPKGGMHQVFHVQTNLSREGQKLLSLFALKRPDGSLSLLVINKDTNHAVRLSGLPLAESYRLATYSAKEYLWQPQGAEGYPLRNNPPTTSLILGKQPVTIPPWSISVIQSSNELRTISEKAN